jgi:hypothetical protein
MFGSPLLLGYGNRHAGESKATTYSPPVCGFVKTVRHSPFATNPPNQSAPRPLAIFYLDWLKLVQEKWILYFHRGKGAVGQTKR